MEQAQRQKEKEELARTHDSSPKTPVTAAAAAVKFAPYTSEKSRGVKATADRTAPPRRKSSGTSEGR